MERYAVMLRIIASEQAEQDALKLDLDALVREGTRRMLLTALKAEVDEYVAQHADQRDEVGHALVVRNGVAAPRTVTTAAGELEIQAPRVRDRREGRASPARSCHPGHDARPKSPKCCRSCICVASRPRTSSRR
jgi:Transposase, Mutator family